MVSKRLLGVLLTACCGCVWTSAGGELCARAEAGMRKAGVHWARKVASHGGFVWEYSTDFVTRRRGESGDLPLSTVWVQAGAPMVGEVFLRVYEVTNDAVFLEAAVAAARCLAWGQLASGGWTYSIEFDLTRNRHRYHHLSAEQAKGLRNTTTFDDNNTQSATRFLMHVDEHVDDVEVTAAIDRALACFLAAQYGEGAWDGAWPQRYPPPKKGYGAYPTYNDNTMSDCVKTVLHAYRQYGKAEYLASVKRCLAFYLRSQQPDPQGVWAQQYDRDLKPAWARRFEPPSVTGAESCGNARLLMDMFLEFGDPQYLAAVGRAVDWYRRSRIGGSETSGRWARFYELGTNRPLYFTRTYKLVYTDDDLPVHYSFRSHYGVDDMIKRYEALRKKGREAQIRARERRRSQAEWRERMAGLIPKVEAILAAQDDLGRWVKVVPQRNLKRDKDGRISYEENTKKPLPMIYSRTLVRNMRLLADYAEASRASAE